jgi:phosphoenolpyruvate carboxylase
MEGRGSLRDIKEKQKLREKAELVAFEDFNVMYCANGASYAVLSGSVLGIINDLTDAIRGNNLNIKELLAQLENTFTPNHFDEAVSLIWVIGVLL